MAIVDMDRISLVALESQKHQILKLLMKKGIVQIDDSSELLDDQQWNQFLVKDGDQSNVSLYDQKMTAIEQAITVLNTATKRKKPLFSKPSQAEQIDTTQAEEFYSLVVELNTLSRNIVELKANENGLKNKIASLAPWEKLDISLEVTQTKFTRVVLGIMPANLEREKVEIAFAEEHLAAVCGVVDSDLLNSYVYLVSHKTDYDRALEQAKEFGFSPVTFSDVTGTPAQAIKSCESLIAKSENERADIDAQILKISEKTENLEKLYDYLSIKKQQAEITSHFVKTKTSFCFNGWVEASKSSELEAELTEKFDCCIYITPGDKKEGIPILLKNNAFVEPFESITSMYSLPHSSNMDPNTILAIFYFIFYGFMLSDAGYGIIMTVLCSFVTIKYKPDGGMGKMIRMFAICGISTTLWGLLFGSVFGGLIPFPALLNPLEDVMPIMGMAIFFGIAHIYAGLGMKAYMLIRDGDPLAVIWDVMSWYLFITGLVILVAPSVVAGISPTLLVVGKYLAIAGMVILILTQGRDKKGLFGKIFGGVSSLYGITGYFADILSYLRLMALCLATGVIATVINIFVDMVGIIPAIAIGLFGHTLNFFINALGSYVHTSRLQYVEFFGKFYEGGGKAFNPFKLKSKYVTFEEEK
jgi:V/A-type H+-transporting ATPase subunit I